MGASGKSKYNMLAMEADFVARPIKTSVRQVAIDHGVPSGSISVVQTYAKANDWDGKWDRRHDRSEGIVEEKLAHQTAALQLREVQVRSDAVEFMAEAIASARAGLKETHFVKEHDEDGAETWVERPKHPASVSQVTNLIDKLNTVFGGSVAPPGGNSDPAGELGSGIAGFIAAAAQQSGGGTEFLVGLLGAARRGAGEPEPRRVGAGAGRDPSAGSED